MALSFGFFSDPALTTRIAELALFFDVTAPSVAHDRTVYFGSPVAGRVAVDAAAPWVDDIHVGVASGGAGVPASAVKLALSSAGLATAVGGSALAIGPEVESGVAGAVPVFVRIQVSAAVGEYVNLGLATQTIAEYAA